MCPHTAIFTRFNSTLTPTTTHRVRDLPSSALYQHPRSSLSHTHISTVIDISALHSSIASTHSNLSQYKSLTKINLRGLQSYYKYIESNKYPSNANTNIKRRIRAQPTSKYKTASGGRLISHVDGRELLPEGNALQIVTRIHQESHMGILNTNRALNKAFICQQDARRLVAESVQACQTCQFRARVKYKKQNKAQIFKMAH